MPASTHGSSFYDLLGVTPAATAREIRLGYLKAAQTWHPDLNRQDADADRRFKQIRRIYEILSDPVLRATYDEDPTRFRLTETGVVTFESETVIARQPPARTKGGAAPEFEVHGRAHAFRPKQTLSRNGIDNAWVFAAGVAAMVALVLLSVVAVRHRQTRNDGVASRATHPFQDRESSTERGGMRPPMGVVIDSLNSLRSDDLTPASNGQAEASDALSDDAKASETPTIDVVDGLNAPSIGWPALPLPPGISSSASTPSVDMPNDMAAPWEPPGLPDEATDADPLAALLHVTENLQAPSDLGTVSGFVPADPIVSLESGTLATTSTTLIPAAPPLPFSNDAELRRQTIRMVVEQAQTRSRNSLAPDQMSPAGSPFSASARSPLPSGIIDSDFANRLPPPPNVQDWSSSPTLYSGHGSSATSSRSALLRVGPMQKANADIGASSYGSSSYGSSNFGSNPYGHTSGSWPTGYPSQSLNTAPQPRLGPSQLGLGGRAAATNSVFSRGRSTATRGAPLLRSMVTPSSLRP